MLALALSLTRALTLALYAACVLLASCHTHKAPDPCIGRLQFRIRMWQQVCEPSATFAETLQRE